MNMKMRMLSLLLCFVMLVGLMPITALAADTYTVTFKAGGGSGTMDPVTVEAGEYTLPECTFSNEGYEFKAWAYNSNVGEQLQPGTKITIRDNIRLYAVWQAKSYTITAVSEDENKGTVTGTGTYEYSEQALLKATPKEGYVFEGWYKDGVRVTGSSSQQFFFVSGDATYTAKFTKADDIITAANAVIDVPAAGANPDMTPEVPEADKDKYTVTFYKWYDSSYNEMSAGDTFEGGKEYELRVVFEAKEGYKFGGTTFTVNGEATEDFTDENPYSVTRRKIQFQVPAAATYPVTIIGGTFAVDGTSSSGNYAPDSVIGITANAPESGNQFKEWVSDEVSFTDATATTTSFRMPAKAVTITATYENIPAVTYTVSFDANGGTGTMAPATGIFGEYTLPANEFTAPSGKQFKAWSVGGVEKAAHEKITVTADTIVTAVWENIPVTYYTVTFNSNGGTGTMTDVTGVSGEYTLPENGFTAPDGMQFKAWSVGGVEKAAGATITVNANTTVTAIWENIPVTYYTVTFDSNGGSAVTAQTIEAGQKATKPADPTKDGFDFTGWTLNGSAYDFNSAVNGDITLVASWEQQQVVPTTYTVTFAANGGTGTMADVTGISGEYTLPANGFTAPDGKQFKAWSVGGVEKAVGDKITVTADTTVIAVWEDVPAVHTCDVKLVAKDEPTCTEGGKEAYYKCEGCGKFFEDALGAKEITDLAAWGNVPENGHTESDWKSDKDNHWKECTVTACGVIIENSKAAHKDENNDGKCDVCEYNVGTPTTPTEPSNPDDDPPTEPSNPSDNPPTEPSNPDDDPPIEPSNPGDNPPTGDNSMMWLWAALLFVSSASIAATTVFGKKRFSVK